MIAFVQGTIESVGTDSAVIRVGGVGLQVHVPVSVAETVGDVGQPVTLYTTLLIRDEMLELFGFPTPQGKRLFDLLTGVSGVGARLALSILSEMTPDEAAVAIASGNSDALTAARGVGKKNAARIVVDLQAKLMREWEATAARDGSEARNEVAAALQALGYSSAEVRKAVADAGDLGGLSLEERVRRVLQRLGQE